MTNLQRLFFTIIRLLRGILDRILWLKLDFLSSVQVVVSAYLSFAVYNISVIYDNNSIFKLFSVSDIATLSGLIVFIYYGISLFLDIWSDVVFERIKALQQNDIVIRKERDEKIITLGAQSILFYPSVNKILEKGNNPISYSKTYFEIHPLIEKMIPQFIFRMPETNLDTFDSEKVSLKSDVDADFITSGNVVFLQRSSYFRDRLSNTLANYNVYIKGRPFLNMRNEVIDRNNHLIDLRVSKLSNQLGASTILITADKTITYLRQGNRVAENARKAAPAGSGSFDPLSSKKTMESLTFQDYIRNEAKRELIEECGLKSDDVLNIQICGFGRYLYRNGKPEAFCIATTSKCANEIQPPIRERDYQQKESISFPFAGSYSGRNVAKAFTFLQKQMEEEYNKFENISGPLYWNVIFAKEYLLKIDIVSQKALFNFN